MVSSLRLREWLLTQFHVLKGSYQEKKASNVTKESSSVQSVLDYTVIFLT